MNLPARQDTRVGSMSGRPGNPRISIHQFATATSSPGLARRAVAEILRTWNLTPLTDTAGLLVSELMTNAVQASASSGHDQSPVALRLSWAAASLIIEVWDRDDRPPVVQEQRPDAPGGRGLYIVEMLSTSAAYYPSPTGQGKVTWCQIEAPALPEAMVTSPLPRRLVPTAHADPLEVFDDLAVLQRVVDGLRALDTRLPRRDSKRY
jgi:anti-sigma regulatory factor (Ser/Thr protein kinase)